MTSPQSFAPDALLSRSPQQLSCDLDGQVALLSVANGRYYSMNEMGSRIWAMLETPCTAASIVARLLEEFEVAPPTCENEVAAFLTKLKADGLLVVEGKRGYGRAAGSERAPSRSRERRRSG